MGWRENSDEGIITTPGAGTFHDLLAAPAAGKMRLLIGMTMTSDSSGVTQSTLIKKKGATRYPIDTFIGCRSGLDYMLGVRQRVLLDAEDEILELEVVLNPDPADLTWTLLWADID
jgi:hypothetical protein